MTARARFADVGPIPARAGIGLRGPHYQALLDDRPDIGWLEAHSENFFGAGGAPRHYLERARALYPLSLHGVGLSLGSTDPLDQDHLKNLKRLIEDFEPALVSEHLSWSSFDSVHFNDLLPLPYTEEALRHFAVRVMQTQETLGRQILIENPSSYLSYTHSTIPEAEFLVAVAHASDCGILLDVNNIHVSARNHGLDEEDYIHAVPPDRIQEIHLAGFSVNSYPEGEIAIDDHGSAISDRVWELLDMALDHCGPVPTLVEWDSNIPSLSVLVGEAQKAQARLEGMRAVIA